MTGNGKPEKPLISERMLELIKKAEEVEQEDAKAAGKIGFMARAFVQANLPYRDLRGANEHVRRNGPYTLTMLSPSSVGLPFGVIPRLLLSWITVEALRTQDRTLVLGDTLSSFMQELGMVSATGGRWGTITRLREQIERLFRCYITLDRTGPGNTKVKNVLVADEYDLWWDPHPDQPALWESTVELNEKFFREIIDRPVPVDMRALHGLRHSPLALDTYCWLTYRMSYLGKPTTIPWPLMMEQFGADYARARDFRKAFDEGLRKVLTFYTNAKVTADREGVHLAPSSPHIRRIPRDKG